MLPDIKCDVAIVGGGLAGSLAAYALRQKRRELDVRLIEPGPSLGGNHVWSFFSNDVEPENRWLVDPFVSHRWNGYEVRFPGHRRDLGVQYNMIRSEQLDRVVRDALLETDVIRGRITHIRPDALTLENGQHIRAGGVIDARGLAQARMLELGWQKFVGQELRLARAHRVEKPIVMDATVPQDDGFRFIYLLPTGENRVFIEDTYYSDSPQIDRDRLAGRIADYASAGGWEVTEVLREESGALPVVLGGDFQSYWHSGGYGVAKIGARAGLFHPTTGYSLPDAVRTAADLLTIEDLTGETLHDRLFERARALWHERRFYRLLDRMLFRAAEPGERYKVLERFYGLNPALIGRFYASRSTALDKLRILSGRPPVPIGRAIGVMREKHH